MPRSGTVKLAAVVGAVALAAAACGGSSKSTSSANKTLSAAPGFDPVGKTIHVGVITPLTGPVAAIGKPLTAGNEVWFKYLNQEKGGIAGKYQVVLDEEDSQYVPQNAVQAYQKIKGNEVVIAQLLGTPVTKAVLPLLKQDNVVAQPASLDADWVPEQNLVPLGGPYQIQMINAADYIAKDAGLKSKKWCDAIQDDAYGQAGQAGLQFGAQAQGVSIASVAKFPAANADFTPQVQQLKSAGCEVVFLTSVPSDTAKFMAKAAQLQFAPQWVGQSPSYIGALAASPLKDYLAAHFLVVGEGTEWGDTSVPGMADMVSRLQKYDPAQAPDYYFGFGYNEARAVTALLEKAVQLGDLSRQGIVNALNRLGTVSFDGLTGDYTYATPAQRVFPRSSTMFKVNPAKPVGLEKVKYNFQSDSAKTYKLPGT